MAFVHVNGIDLHYTIDGSQGPWITLSHSLACNSSAWDAQVELLKNDFRVLRFDTRGHGQSSAPAGPYTLEQLADGRTRFVHASGHSAYALDGHFHGRHDRPKPMPWRTPVFFDRLSWLTPPAADPHKRPPCAGRAHSHGPNRGHAKLG
jgi:hypothetical protein